jgi:hypothetical protein
VAPLPPKTSSLVWLLKGRPARIQLLEAALKFSNTLVEIPAAKSSHREGVPGMSFFDSSIDPTEFGIVADYLLSPQSPISFLLQVKEETMLPILAIHLDLILQSGPVPVDRLPGITGRLLQQGSLKVSARCPVNRANLTHSTIDATEVPRHAPCKVIYLPPYYLVHTPGHFFQTP